MAKILGQIPQQNFEIIRDQIGAILTLELADQTDAGADEFEVWSERVVNWNNEEKKVINVTFDNAPYDNHNPKSRTGENQYFIDVIALAQHEGDAKTEKGDVLASLLVQRIAGVIAYILSSPEYYYLDFQPGLIQSRWVSEIKTGKLQEQDATHRQVCRVTFKVKANELVGDLTGVQTLISSSQVKLDDTDKGHKYEIVNP